MKQIIHSFISYCLFFLLVFIYFVPFLIIVLIPEKKRLNSRFVFFTVHSFYFLILKITFLPITIFGKSNIPEAPAIIIANHQSALDIPLMGLLMKTHPHIFLARTDSTHFSIIRWFYSKFSIMVDLSSAQKSFKSVRELLHIAHDFPAHIIIFPEGERHIDGKIHEFADGFSFLAKKTKRPIVPVYIFGVDYAYPPSDFLISYVPVHMLVGKPIFFEENDTDQTFAAKIVDWYKRQTGEH